MLVTAMVNAYQSVIRSASFCVSVVDQLAIEFSGHGPLPPAHLRARVHGGIDLVSFLNVGQGCARDLVAALQRAGRQPGGVGSVLDFGCGCGRTLLWLHKLLPGARWYGTDIDADAIAWSRANFRFGEFQVNAPTPPLAYPDGAFDFVYGISVLTHLDEAMQFLWLEELRRVTRPGGIVLLTVHGYEQWKSLPLRWQDELRERGIAFVPSQAWRGIFPEWYQNTYHTQEYVQAKFAQYFAVKDYLPCGLNGHQDIVVLERRA